MKMKFYISIFIAFLTLSFAAQDAELNVKVSKNKLGLNQRLRIEFSINKQGADDFSPPKFDNFRIIQGPSQSVSQSWINGKVSFSQSYSYILKPKRRGELIISPANIKYRGKTLNSKMRWRFNRAFFVLFRAHQNFQKSTFPRSISPNQANFLF